MKVKSSIKKILLINKNLKDGTFLEKALLSISSSFDVIKARDVKRGTGFLNSEKIDAVFMDYPLFSSAPEFIREIQKVSLYVPVIVIIQKGKELQAAEALKQGAYDYLLKDGGYEGPLTRVLERIQRTSIPDKETEDDLEQQSVLFRKIYKSQKWWQHIIDSITDYIFVIDQNYRILRTNKAFSNLFGKDPADIIMRPYYELFGLSGPHEWCVAGESRESASRRAVERTLNDTYYLISYYPISYDEHEAAVYIMKDITETRRLKDQVYHLDKLSSLGTLTSGVAHEINNPLTGIIGYTEMLLMKNEDDTTKKYLRNVYDSALRCKRIVENMLTFSRQTPAQKSVENINDIIDKTVELHEYWLKSTNIEIIKNYGKVPYVSVDRQQMQQVVLNLLINAEQAISDTDRRGRIEFKTSFDSESNYTLIEVSDNGNGIPPEILPKIFDPFFTTKPVNKGTGLGLSIAHGIIAEQGGTIEARSVAGKGTSFIIRIPQATD